MAEDVNAAAQATNQAGDTQAANGNTQAGSENTQADQTVRTVPQIDYSKIQSMLDGTLKAKEETALKSYFREQGLEQKEIESAIADYKAKKAAETPDIGKIKSEAETAKKDAETVRATAQKAITQAQIQSTATLAAVQLGVSPAQIQYVLRLADTSSAVGKDGTVDAAAVSAAIQSVLDAVPAFKSAAQPAQSNGFQQVGAGPTQQAGEQQSRDELMKSIFRIRETK